MEAEWLFALERTDSSANKQQIVRVASLSRRLHISNLSETNTNTLASLVVEEIRLAQCSQQVQSLRAAALDADDDCWRSLAHKVDLIGANFNDDDDEGGQIPLSFAC